MKNKLQKTLSGLGVAVTSVLPLTTVVACGDEDPAKIEMAGKIGNKLQRELVNPGEYGTFVNEAYVLQIIKNIAGEKTFTAEDLMFTSNDAEGTLTITILSFYAEGDDLTITLFGFKEYETNDTIPTYAYANQIIPSWFTIPKTVTTIEDGAFENATLNEGFVVPEDVTTIGASAFKDVQMAEGLTWYDNQGNVQPQNSTPKAGWYIAIYIETEALSKAIDIEENLTERIVRSQMYGTFVNENDVLSIIQYYEPNTTIEDVLFTSNDAEGTLTITILNYYGEENDLIITLEGFQKYDSVDTVPTWTYSNVTLPTWFTIPDTVVTIGEYAFENATFPGDFFLPNSVVIIGERAFDQTTFFGDFFLPNSVATIGEYAFCQATFLGDFTLANTQIKSIGWCGFWQTTLPDGFAMPEIVAFTVSDVFKDVQMAEGLTWYSADGQEQNPSDTPEAGWYIAPMGL